MKCMVSFPFYSFQNSTTQGTDTRKDWMSPQIAVASVLLRNSIFLQVCKCDFHTVSFHLQVEGTSDVLARISSRDS